MTDAKTNTVDTDPATAAVIVFRDELLREIGEENARLRDEVARIRPLLDHIQRVDLIAAINDEIIDPYRGPMVEVDGVQVLEPNTKIETIASVQLCNGMIQSHEDVDKLILSVESSQEIMVANLSFFGGIGVDIAKKSIGFFPETHRVNASGSGNVAESTAVGFTEDDEAELSIYISDNICIKGALNNLSNEDFIRFKENPVTETGYRHNIFICESRPRLTFFPKSIVMDIIPTLAETLNLVEKANATTGDSLSPSDELRSLTLGAIGTESQKRALNENLMLKAQREALGKVKEKLMRVDICHRDGIVSFSLDEGELKTEDNGDLLWKIRIEGKENSSMAVHSICDSAFSVSGSAWNTQDLSYYVEQGQGFIAGSERNRFLGLVIPYYYGIEVVGVINWYEQNEDDLPGILNSYHQKVFASVSRMFNIQDADGNAAKPFPDTFRLELLYVTFRPHLIKDMFNMVGCDDLLVAEGNEKSTE